MVRNVAVAGHLHHGKTALMDMLVFETHKLIWDADKPVHEFTASQSSKSWQSLPQIRYTDTHILSREREVSIKSSPMSLVLQNTSGKSHLVHLIDTPGHVNFVDEVATAMRLADGILLVVDVVEGVRIHSWLSLHLLIMWVADGWYRAHHSTRFARRYQDYSDSEQDRQAHPRTSSQTCWCVFQDQTHDWGNQYLHKVSTYACSVLLLLKQWVVL